MPDYQQHERFGVHYLRPTSDSRWQRFFAANLVGHGSVKLTSRMQCRHRGLHRFGPVTIESQVPFGLFRRRNSHPATLSLLVYPRAYPMRELGLFRGAVGDSGRPQKSRGGQETVGSRYYVPGDPLRLIHWRNTARLRRLAVKEMEDNSERALTVLLDAHRTDGRSPEATLDYSVRLAATIGISALRSGESVNLIAGDVEGEWIEAEPFLRELALLQPAEGSPPMATLIGRVWRTSRVVAIVAATDAEGARALEQSAIRLPGLGAVVLEGFGAPEAEAGSADVLRQAGVPTVVCRQGALAEAVRKLESFSSARG